MLKQIYEVRTMTILIKQAGLLTFRDDLKSSLNVANKRHN